MKLAPAFLLAVAVSSCAGCVAGLQRTAVVRSNATKRALTVQISVRCDNFPPGGAAWGSGVVISPNAILTAAHVVDCEVRDPKTQKVISDGKPVAIFASQPDDIGHRMRIETSFITSDIARLRIADDSEFTDADEVQLARVELLDPVCVSTGVPRRDVRCGVVEELYRSPANDISISIPTYSGNSGSGLYDRRGRLVGIVTQRRNLALDAQISGGRATSLGGRSWALDARVLIVKERP